MNKNIKTFIALNKKFALNKISKFKADIDNHKSTNTLIK